MAHFSPASIRSRGRGSIEFVDHLLYRHYIFFYSKIDESETKRKDVKQIA